MGIPIVACDVDDVLADWARGLHQVACEILGVTVPLFEDCHRLDFSLNFGVTRKIILEIAQETNLRYPILDLPYVEGAREALESLEGRFELALVTGRPDEQYEETLAWAQKRVPGARVYLSGGKGNPYAANEGRDSKEEIACRLGAICLIDDNVGEFLGWDWSCSILPVCFAQPWNQSVPPNVIRCNWQQITRLLTSRLTGRP